MSNTAIIPKPVIITIVLEFIGTLQKMHSLRSLVRRNIYVLIDLNLLQLPLYYYMKNVYYIMIYVIKSERSKKSKWNKYLYYFKLCTLRKGNECICKQQCY